MYPLQLTAMGYVLRFPTRTKCLASVRSLISQINPEPSPDQVLYVTCLCVRSCWHELIPNYPLYFVSTAERRQRTVPAPFSSTSRPTHLRPPIPLVPVPARGA